MTKWSSETRYFGLYYTISEIAMVELDKIISDRVLAPSMLMVLEGGITTSTPTVSDGIAESKRRNRKIRSLVLSANGEYITIELDLRSNGQVSIFSVFTQENRDNAIKLLDELEGRIRETRRTFYISPNVATILYSLTIPASFALSIYIATIAVNYVLIDNVFNRAVILITSTAAIAATFYFLIYSLAAVSFEFGAGVNVRKKQRQAVLVLITAVIIPFVIGGIFLFLSKD